MGRWSGSYQQSDCFTAGSPLFFQSVDGTNSFMDAVLMPSLTGITVSGQTLLVCMFPPGFRTGLRQSESDSPEVQGSLCLEDIVYTINNNKNCVVIRSFAVFL